MHLKYTKIQAKACPTNIPLVLPSYLMTNMLSFDRLLNTTSSRERKCKREMSMCYSWKICLYQTLYRIAGDILHYKVRKTVYDWESNNYIHFTWNCPDTLHGWSHYKLCWEIIPSYWRAWGLLEVNKVDSEAPKTEATEREESVEPARQRQWVFWSESLRGLKGHR